MKLSDVKQLNEVAVYDTPEYDLSSKDQQRYAYLAKAPDLKPEEIMNLYGAGLYTFNVTLNTGEKFTVKPYFNKYKNVDISGVTSVQFKDPETRKNDTYYMVSGSKPTQKKAKFFRKNDVDKQMTEMRNTFIAALIEYSEKFQKKLQYELRDKLSPAAKEALNDNLLGMIDEKDYSGLYNWFKSKGFTMNNSDDIPSPEEFKKMTSLLGWNIKTDNRYRAAQGVSMTIDWEKKQFNTIGWSSDD